jgi:hypothetical protein
MLGNAGKGTKLGKMVSSHPVTPSTAENHGRALLDCGHSLSRHMMAKPPAAASSPESAAPSKRWRVCIDDAPEYLCVFCLPTMFYCSAEIFSG